MNGILIFNLQFYEQKTITQKLFNPHWHELWKQEKCSSLVPPRGIFYKTQWAWQVDVKFHLQKSLAIFDKQSADKVQSKKDKGIKPIRVRAYLVTAVADNNWTIDNHFDWNSCWCCIMISFSCTPEKRNQWR